MSVASTRGGGGRVVDIVELCGEGALAVLVEVRSGNVVAPVDVDVVAAHLLVFVCGKVMRGKYAAQGKRQRGVFEVLGNNLAERMDR